MWRLSYAFIIATEGLTGILFLVDVVRLWQARRAPAANFNRAKAYAIAGALLAFLVWFFGFMVVAGEWFAMWESKVWNGQEAAFRFYVTVLAVLIFVNQSDGDVAVARPTPARTKQAAAKPRPSRRRADKGRRRADTAGNSPQN